MAWRSSYSLINAFAKLPARFCLFGSALPCSGLEGPGVWRSMRSGSSSGGSSASEPDSCRVAAALAELEAGLTGWKNLGDWQAVPPGLFTGAMLAWNERACASFFTSTMIPLPMMLGVSGGGVGVLSLGSGLTTSTTPVFSLTWMLAVPSISELLLLNSWLKMTYMPAIMTSMPSVYRTMRHASRPLRSMRTMAPETHPETIMEPS
mmetsp:Transcript_20803/g.58364  ORF Transcript_20803/g.58364 Transcript_20803/m.58364 type:complete len:206 (-) Transcript_20803:859-1476(-)